MSNRTVIPNDPPSQVRPRRPTFQHRPLPYAGAVPREDSGSLVALVEIDWSAGTEYYSFTSVRSPSVEYLPYVTRISPIKRQVSLFGGAMSFGNVNVSLVNTSRQFSIKWATTPIRGLSLRVKMVDLNLGYSSALTLFEGKIVSYELSGGTLNLTARSSNFDELFASQVSQTIPMVVKDYFGRLPDGQAPSLVPLIFGRVGGAWSSATGGSIVAFMIEDSGIGQGFLYDYVYVVAARPIASAYGGGGPSATTAFRYGGVTLGSYSLSSAHTYNGVQFHCFAFSVDQRDTTRPDEPEITFNADGITETDSSIAAPILNPVRALEYLLDTYTSLDSGDFDSGLQTTATNTASTNLLAEDSHTYTSGVQASMGAAITDAQRTFREEIERFCESFAMSFYALRNGLLATFVMDFGAEPVADFSVDDETDILRNSLVIRNNPEVASVLQWNHSFRWSYAKRGDALPGQFFERQPDYVIPGEKAKIGGTDVRKSVNLWYTRRTSAALNVIRSHAEFYKSEAQIAEFDLPVRFYRWAELNRYIGITHWQGISASGGYAGAVGRIVGLDYIVQPSSMKIHVRTFIRAGGTIVRDDFTRADATDVGATYTQSKANVDAYKIVSNQLQFNNYGGCAFVSGCDTDQLASLRLIIGSGVPRLDCGPAVRASGTHTNFTGYVAIWAPFNAQIRLIKFVNEDLTNTATGTQLGSFTCLVNAFGTDEVLEIRATGTTIEVWNYSSVPENHGKLITVTDAAISTGQPGWAVHPRVAGVPTITADNFYARDF